MQNKGLVKLFAFLFGLVSIYQLSFTFKGNQIEKNAEQFAINKIADSDVDYDSKRNLERLNYLDSLNNKEVFNIGIASFDYKEVKEKAMNLGLDLKGGINVILQISVKDILLGLASDSKDPTFKSLLYLLLYHKILFHQDLFSHIRYMMITTIPTFILTLIIFTIVGYNLDVDGNPNLTCLIDVL